MVPFIKIINGPPCGVSKDTTNISLQPVDTKNNSDVNIVDWVCDIIQAQEMAVSSIELEHIWQQYFQKIGVSMFSYYQVYDGVEKQNHSSLMFQYGLPKIWKNIFNRQGYFQKHPLVSIVLEKNVPLRYSDISDYGPKNDKEAQYIKALHDLKISDGIAFPVFSFGQCYGFFVLGFELTQSEITSAQIELLQYCLQKAHSRHLALNP